MSDLIKNFRDCLGKADKGSVEWQDTISRLVGLAHVRAHLDETPLLEAMTLMSLIALAEIEGSKEAKKRIINTSKIKTKLPEQFALPDNESESLAYLSFLSKIKEPWCLDFIRSQLREEIKSKKILDAYLRWTGRNIESPCDVITYMLAPILISNSSEKIKLFSLKGAELMLSGLPIFASKSFAIALYSFSDEWLKLFAVFNGSDKVKSGLFNLLHRYFRNRIGSCPGLTLEVEFLHGVKKIVSSPLGRYKKAWDKELDYFSSVTCLLLGTITQREVVSGESSWKFLLPVLEDTYPKFMLKIKKASESIPTLSLLDDVMKPNIKNQVDDSIDRVAALLIRWEDFRSTTTKSSGELDGINQDLRRVVSSFDLELTGKCDEVLAYDPLLHVLPKSSGDLPRQVRVVKPGVLQRRSDGSFRILIQTVVVPYTG